jgi:branched-chain amino acid aminotransferase
MSQSLFVSLNGEILPANQPLFAASNRSFRYGDGLFETIRFANSKVQFLEKHMARLTSSMELLKINKPAHYTEDFFRKEITGLIEKNQVSRGARIRLTVYRKDGGFYTPECEDPLYIIECEPIEESHYNLNARGHAVDIYPDYKKQIHRLSNIKCNSSLMHVLAAVYKKQNELDDCIILNQNFSIAEAISSNIFAVKNGVLYTPPIVDGCVEGIMRNHIIDVARKHRISVYEVSLAMNVLLNSDELFLTNVINGICWVSGYKTKRFYNTMSKMLVEKLNESLI